MDEEFKVQLKKLGDAIKDDDITKIKQIIEQGFDIKQQYVKKKKKKSDNFRSNILL